MRDAGVSVRLHATRGPVAWRDDRPAAILPCHLEHPWRFVASLGPARAAEIAAFAAVSRALAPRNAPSHDPGWDWPCAGPEGADADADVPAAASIGLHVTRTATGLSFDAGGPMLPGDPSPAPDVLPDEHSPWEDDAVHIYAHPPPPGAPGAERVAEWLLPVRWHAVTVTGTPPPRPRLSRQASVLALPAGPDRVTLLGARWAEPHLGVGDTHTAPSPAVVAALLRLAAQDHPPPPGAPPGAPEVETFVTAESCDGLPIVGALPGQPRVHVCTGFGALGPTYGPAAAHHLADALLGLRPLPLPSTFAPHRLR